MDTGNHRVGFGLLVLLGCSIVAGFGEDKTPSRTVVELVSVVYKPARPVPPEPAIMTASVDPVVVTSPPVETTAPVATAPATRATAMGPARVTVGAAPARTVKVAASPVTVACRPPACRTATRTRNSAPKYTAVRESRPDEPALPAAFRPIRRLGLYLQARIGIQPEPQAASRPGRR